MVYTDARKMRVKDQCYSIPKQVLPKEKYLEKSVMGQLYCEIHNLSVFHSLSKIILKIIQFFDSVLTKQPFNYHLGIITILTTLRM